MQSTQVFTGVSTHFFPWLKQNCFCSQTTWLSTLKTKIDACHNKVTRINTGVLYLAQEHVRTSNKHDLILNIISHQGTTVWKHNEPPLYKLTRISKMKKTECITYWWKYEATELSRANGRKARWHNSGTPPTFNKPISVPRFRRWGLQHLFSHLSLPSCHPTSCQWDFYAVEVATICHLAYEHNQVHRA